MRPPYVDTDGRWAESFLDIALISYDLTDIYNNGLNWTNGVSLVANGVGLAVPVGTGFGAGTRALMAGEDAAKIGANSTQDLISKNPVLLDSNVTTALRVDPSLGGRIFQGDGPLLSYVSIPEMRNAVVHSNLKGVPGAAFEIPTLQAVPSLDLRINIRGMLPDTRGRFGDGIIGAQAIENGIPLISNDKNLKQAVRTLGGEVR